MAGAGAPAAPQAAGFDVIVIGAGIMGSCTAHAAASRGSRVLLLERFDLLHPLGSSHGDSRIIRDAYAEPRYLRMVRLARRLWAAAEAEAGYRVLTPTPHLSMGPRSSAALAAAVANIGAEELVRDDLGSRWDGAFACTVPDPSDAWVTALSDYGGVLSATKAVAMFQSLAVAKGAVVRDNTEVVGIEKAPEGGVVVKASGGEAYHGAKCVVTVGAWAAKLLGSVSGVDLPIRPLHTLHLYWRVKPGQEQSLSAKGGFPTFSSYGDPPVYGAPSLEVPGLIKISCDGGPPCDPDARDWLAGDAEVTDRVARWIQEAMRDHVDAAGGPVVRQSCMCSMTPDADFVMDFLGGELGRDVVVGVGFSGHGFKMGPAVGRILAEMAIDGGSETAEEAGIDLGFFRIGRFDGNPLGNANKDELLLPSMYVL